MKASKGILSKKIRKKIYIVLHKMKAVKTSKGILSKNARNKIYIVLHKMKALPKEAKPNTKRTTVRTPGKYVYLRILDNEKTKKLRAKKRSALPHTRKWLNVCAWEAYENPENDCT